MKGCEGCGGGKGEGGNLILQEGNGGGVEVEGGRDGRVARGLFQRLIVVGGWIAGTSTHAAPTSCTSRLVQVLYHGQVLYGVYLYYSKVPGQYGTGLVAWS